MFRGLVEKVVGWFEKKPTIIFKSVYGAYNLYTPVIEARKLLPYWLASQLANKSVKFTKCPGMSDIARCGYLIRAPYDIHIKATSEGTRISLGVPVEPIQQPTIMDSTLIAGLPPLQDNVKLEVWKIPLPWHIRTKKGYSALVLPAQVHSPFLGEVFVYPGVIDFDEFYLANLILTVLCECELTIPANTVLLQVIPFKREPISALVGKATTHEQDVHKHFFFSRVAGFYRKVMYSKKTYTLTTEEPK